MIAEEAWEAWRPYGSVSNPMYEPHIEAAFLAGYRQAVKNAQKVLAGEDTVEWAREAQGSLLQLSWTIELLDDMLEEDE